MSAVQSANTVFDNTILIVDSNTSNAGSAFRFVGSTLVVKNSSVSFTNNSAVNDKGGALYLSNSTCTFTRDSGASYTEFALNNASNNGGSGGAVCVEQSSLTFAQEVFFTSNTAKDAGGAKIKYCKIINVMLNI
jgi:predicted outer membrane repeat protein